MVEKVYKISGNKVSSLITDQNSLKLSSKTFNTVEEFETAWRKKISLATKLEIKYNLIKAVKKEDKQQNIVIRYKTFAGIVTNCTFSFNDSNDYETFFSFLQREQYFTKQIETLTPIKAIATYLLGIAAVIAFTIFAYYQAIAIANGTASVPTNAKGRLFNSLVGWLGDKGVLAVGALITGYLVYQAWKRFTNPPDQLQFLPRIS